MYVLLQNVMYMFSWQINGWILKEYFGESQEGIMEDGNLAEGDQIDGVSRYVSKHIHMQSYHVHKYIMSARWVFPAWIGFSQ